jgi:hypothetical protein
VLDLHSTTQLLINKLQVGCILASKSSGLDCIPCTLVRHEVTKFVGDWHEIIQICWLYIGITLFYGLKRTQDCLF